MIWAYINLICWIAESNVTLRMECLRRGYFQTIMKLTLQIQNESIWGAVWKLYRTFTYSKSETTNRVKEIKGLPEIVESLKKRLSTNEFMQGMNLTFDEYSRPASYSDVRCHHCTKQETE